MKEKIKGLRALVVFIPTIIIISVLYIIILVSTIFINRYTKDITKEMENSSDLTNEISKIQGTSSKLIKTCQSFVLNSKKPKTDENGNVIIDENTHMPVFELNNAPLMAYIGELTDENRDFDDSLEAIKDYGASKTLISDVSVALDAINEMILHQSHAIHLLNACLTEEGIGIPDNIMAMLQPYELSDKEIGYSADEKRIEASNLILKDPDYNDNESEVSTKLREASSIANDNSLKRQKSLTRHIRFARGILWESILLILIFNIILFVILLKKLVFPITRFAKRIDENERLDSNHALYEANYLASSYNALLDRHKEFEKELIDVAEFDSLTGLQNRYCYNKFLNSPITEDKSVCVLLFDINNLKYVNDTFGHARGDELIKNSSSCIKGCFLDKEGKNCYRIGGDEFVAIIDNISIKEVEEKLEKFRTLQKEYNISIATGFSYSESIKDIGYERLIIDADKKMYDNKEMMKKELNKKLVV